jgi:hypothetical protein
VLLAESAPFGAIAVAATVAGFMFRSVVHETALDWFVAVATLPLGYAPAGPVASPLGISRYLRIGAAWVVLRVVGVSLVPGVRDLRVEGAA